MYIEQQERSEVTFNGMTLHNGTTRNMMDVHLVGRHAAINAYGAVVANAQEHVDNNILIDHNAEECTSDLLYKYVLDDKSVGAFAGKVLVQAGAQKNGFSGNKLQPLCQSGRPCLRSTHARNLCR